MDAVREQVAEARTALATAVAKAGLEADPVGQALLALSLSLGAQLDIHDAAMAHFEAVTARLDQAVAEAVRQGEAALNARRESLVAAVVPQLVETVQRSVRSWNRMITARTLLITTGAAAGILILVGSLGFTAGWNAGEESGLTGNQAFSSALAQAGPESEAVLAKLIRDNDLSGVIADCQRNTYTQDGRRACVIPVWLEPGKAPAKPAR